MSFGEMGLPPLLAGLAVLSLIIAAKAYTAAFAFHAYLFAAASIAGIFLIYNNYTDRQGELPPQMKTPARK